MTKEDSLTIGVADYLHLQYPNVLFTHIANERQTSPMRGAKLKRMGVRAGMPDIMVFREKRELLQTQVGEIVNIKYIGLAIELKIGANKPTESQMNCISKLINERWA